MRWGIGLVGAAGLLLALGLAVGQADGQRVAQNPPLTKGLALLYELGGQADGQRVAQNPPLTKGLALLYELGGQATALAADSQYVYLALGRRFLVLSYSASAAPTVVGSTGAIAVEPRQIVLGSGTAYLVDPHIGVHVIDIADPKRPQVLQTVRCGDQAMGLAIASRWGYLACGQAGLAVIDLSQPREPVLKAELPTRRFARAVAIRGHHALVAERDQWVSGLWIVDIANPARPVDRGFLLTPGGADHIQVVDDAAFVLGASGSLWVVDVADPEHPTRLGRAELGQATNTIPGYAAAGEQSYGLWATNDYLYVAQGERGLVIVDVRYRRRPLAFEPYDTPGQARDVVVIGRRPLGLVADGVGGLRVIDLASLAKPSELYAYDESPGAIRDVAAGDGFLCLVSQVGGVWAGSKTTLDVVDLAQPGRPTLRSSLDLPGATRSVAAGPSARSASTCAVAQSPSISYERDRSGRVQVTYQGGLQLVDVATLAAPRVAAAWHGAYLMNVAFGESVLYGAWLAGYFPQDTAPLQQPANGLVVVDDRRLHALAEIGRLTVPGQPRWVAADGETVYLAAYEAGLHIISATEPKRPRLLGSLALADRARGVAVLAGVALVTTESQGLVAIDVSDPAQPKEVGRIALVGGGRKVEIEGPYAIVTDGELGVNLIDVSDPQRPQWRDRYVPPVATVNNIAASLHGEYVYVGVDPGALLVLGIVDKPYPTPTTTPPTPRPTFTAEPTLTPSPTLEATAELTPTEEPTATWTPEPTPPRLCMPWLGQGPAR